MTFDDPAELAAVAAATKRPLLIGLDIDGVLAPIVAHADDARLLDGVAAAIAEIAEHPDVHIAAVSGRPLVSMRTFGLPPAVRLIGSHGMEDDHTPMTPLSEVEAMRYGILDALARDAAAEAGAGAWVENKRASLAVHVREADQQLASRALAKLGTAAATIAGAEAKSGTMVLELFARSASKGTAMTQLVADTAAATPVFVGDDVTDEDAFAALGRSAITIKVGDADTIALHRLAGPPAVLEWLRVLGSLLST